MFVFTFGDRDYARCRAQRRSLPRHAVGRDRLAVRALGLSRGAKPRRDARHHRTSTTRSRAAALAAPIARRTASRSSSPTTRATTCTPTPTHVRSARRALRVSAREPRRVPAPLRPGRRARGVHRRVAAEFDGASMARPCSQRCRHDLRSRTPPRPSPAAILGFTEDDVVFCYARPSRPREEHPLARRGVRAAAARTPSRARLLVIGGGPSRADAEAALRGRRARIAHASSAWCPTTGARLRGCRDVFVTGAVSEVHPLVVLEAMAAGLPIVAVSSPGISDTVSTMSAACSLPRTARLAAASRACRDDRAAPAARRGARGPRPPTLSSERPILLGHYERLAAEPGTR